MFIEIVRGRVTGTQKNNKEIVFDIFSFQT